jgi:NTP pyrophosphatase (non-canonical NTP hydrolase)
MKTMGELLKEITGWQDKIFTQATSISAATHLKRELTELVVDLINHDYENARLEMADCFILIAGVAHLSGVDLEAAVEEKMEINRKRTWGKPDKDGVVEHMRDESKPAWKSVGISTIDGKNVELFVFDSKSENLGE